MFLVYPALNIYFRPDYMNHLWIIKLLAITPDILYNSSDIYHFNNILL